MDIFLVFYGVGVIASLITIGFLATEKYWEETVLSFLIAGIAALMWPLVAPLAIGANLRRIITAARRQDGAR